MFEPILLAPSIFQRRCILLPTMYEFSLRNITNLILYMLFPLMLLLNLIQMNPLSDAPIRHHSFHSALSIIFKLFVKVQIRVYFKRIRSAMYDSVNKRTKVKTIQQQFIQHCAVVIQSRFRGYVNRKKYRSFLPIYRRVRQLLLAIYNGWKIRRVMKLPIVKSQINDVKTKLKNNQASLARIAKRQLLDDIDRLSKKGRWIDALLKARTLKANQIFYGGQENNSLYGNIKSKSIKNIFKQGKDNTISQTIKTKHNVFFQTMNTFSNLDPPHKNLDDQPIKRVNIDEKPLKTQYTISICQTQPQNYASKGSITTKRQYLKNGKRDSSKTKNMKTTRNMHQKQQIDTKSNQQIFKCSEQQKLQQMNKRQQESLICQSRTSKSSQISRNKLQITLKGHQNNLMKSTQSIKSIDSSAIDLKIMHSSTSSLSFQKSNQYLPQLVRVYEQKYISQKANMIKKLTQLPMKYTSNLKKDYDTLLIHF